MSLGTLTTAAGPGWAQTADVLKRLTSWWQAQFLDLFPARTADWLVGRNQNKILLIAPTPDAVTIELLTDSRRSIASSIIDRSELLETAIDDLLRSKGTRSDAVTIGVRLPAEKIFARSILIPREALPSIDTIVYQDLIRKMPFRPDDIYCDYRLSGSPHDRTLAIDQWILRKDFLNEALSSLQFDIDRLSFVESNVTIADGKPPAIIFLRRRTDARRSLAYKTIVALLFVTITMSCLAAGSTYWRQQVLIDRLASEVTDARSRAQKVRVNLGRAEQRQAALQRLRTQRAELPRLLEVWEEVTRTLPDHTWLSELRFQEAPQGGASQLVLTGLSAAATSLVGLVARSKMFTDVQLTAPISIDPIEKRERFVLQAKIRKPPGVGGQ